MRGAFFVLVLVASVLGDFYMNHPRGSNNKLIEQQNNVRNDNRLFDSQNNANAGYQIGDNCAAGPCHKNVGGKQPDGTYTAVNANGNYDVTVPGATEGRMKYYTESYLWIEWSAQHGCGAGSKDVNCDMIFQYMCDVYTPGITDGTDTGDDGDGGADYDPAQPAPTSYPTGRHEPWEFFNSCHMRERNKGLFNADQNLQGTQTGTGNNNNNQQTARSTRQQSNGQQTQNKFGYECTEERDYYPYWHPTPWIDIAVLTSDVSRCSYYKRESQNVKPKGYCDNLLYNNQKACTDAQGTWKEEPSWIDKDDKIVTLDCQAAAWSRDNHNGNGIGGQPNSYMWTIPRTPSDKCVLRGRYNITTGDYNGWTGLMGDTPSSTAITAAYNGAASPVKGNPNKDFMQMGVCKDSSGSVIGYYSLDDCQGGTGQSTSGRTWTAYQAFHRLAIATDQFGRTFEDRSHTFSIIQRPDNLSRYTSIWNLNVRGRRGNNQQVYPAVEYDFVPPELSIRQNDFIHFQWTGSDANANNQAGEGRDATDRSNFVQLTSRLSPVPMPFAQNSMIKRGVGLGPDVDIIRRLAYLDQTDCCYKCTQNQKNGQDLQGLDQYGLPENCCDYKGNNDEDDVRNCNVLNHSPGYFDGGLVQMYDTGAFSFASTRNNNFSNRSQKTTITINADLAIIGGVLGGLAAAAVAAAVAAVAVKAYAAGHPASKIASLACYAFPFCCCCYFNSKEKEEKMRTDNGSCARCMRASNSNKAKGLLIYFILNLGIAAYGFCTNYFVAGWNCLFLPDPNVVIWVPFAKIGGWILNFNMALIILPICRNFVSWLRTTPLALSVPLDLQYEFHKLVAAVCALGTTIHVVFHYINYTSGATPWYMRAFGTHAGLTGHALLLCMIILYATAVPEGVRRNRCGFGPCKCKRGFDIFFTCHKLIYLIWPLLWAHGPRWWMWSLFPLSLYFLERTIRVVRSSNSTRLVSAEMFPGRVMRLRMKINHFRYMAGQYVFLNCPAISQHEWHPFTITSAPEEDFVECHIRVGGHWTKPVSDLLCQITAANKKYGHLAKDNAGSGSESEEQSSISEQQSSEESGSEDVEDPTAAGIRLARLMNSTHLIRADGPYGSASEYVDTYDTVLLVGAGIGVTPFASIMKSMKIRLGRNLCGECNERDHLTVHLKPHNVHFVWACRDKQEFSWFSFLIEGIQNDPTIKSIFKFDTYMTETLDLEKFRAQVQAEVKKGGDSAEVDDDARMLKMVKNAGKPNWKNIFKDMAVKFKGQRIGVFLCGPAAIADALEEATFLTNTNRPGDAHFTFHKENF